VHENPITSAFTAGQGDKICYRIRTGYKDRIITGNKNCMASIFEVRQDHKIRTGYKDRVKN
jgi:hypothetical protein